MPGPSRKKHMVKTVPNCSGIVCFPPPPGVMAVDRGGLRLPWECVVAEWTDSISNSLENFPRHIREKLTDRKREVSQPGPAVLHAH